VDVAVAVWVKLSFWLALLVDTRINLPMWFRTSLKYSFYVVYIVSMVFCHGILTIPVILVGYLFCYQNFYHSMIQLFIFMLYLIVFYS
jgi:hypothetical protein